MDIHKKTKFTPLVRKEIADKYYKEHKTITELSKIYSTTRRTVTKIIIRAKVKDYTVHKSINKRFRTIQYGLRRLAKIEKELEEKLKKQAKRYNKNYPGEMVHMDTKRLPYLEGETKEQPREYLFIAIDDYSRELYGNILPDKTQLSSTEFLKQVIEECPYSIETIYTDNGSEYRGNPYHHTFVKGCLENRIHQQFTQARRPQTNGKAERVIRTIMDMWHQKTQFKSRQHRKQELIRFINYYNTVKPHQGIDNLTPMEKLINYFYPTEL